MTDKPYPVYDFLTASRVERALSSALKTWMAKFNKLFSERWSDFAPTQVTTSALLINAQSFEQTRMKWSQPGVGISVEIDGRQVPSAGDVAVNGMLVISRVDFLLLMMEILGQSSHQKPDDRNLTAIESSMCQLFFQTVASVFGEAWPAKESLPISLREPIAEPDNSRLFSPQHEVLVTGFEIETELGAAAGSAQLHLVLDKTNLKQLLNVKDDRVDMTGAKKIDPENVEAIDVELSASLGTAHLLMSDLIQLEPGSIIQLDQSIHRPVSVLINETPALLAWPGKSERNSSIMIEAFAIVSDSR